MTNQLSTNLQALATVARAAALTNHTDKAPALNSLALSAESAAANNPDMAVTNALLATYAAIVQG